MAKLTWSGRALIITLLFRMIFGGYLIGKDQFCFNDVESALSVLFLYSLIGIFATIFLLGKRFGLLALIVLDVVFVVSQGVFVILALNRTINSGLHGPLANWWGAILMFTFSLLTIIFSIRAYRETKGEK